MSGWNSFAHPTTAASGGFSFGTPSGTNTSQANTTFDATTGLNGTTVIFQPVTGSDTIMSFGLCKNINIRHQCISFMKEYVTFTLEEIRCADYMANPKLWANGATGSFGAAPNQTSPAKRAKQDFGEIFNEQLKCYICESFPKAGKHYWYRCMQGHMVCHECKEARKPSFFKFGASSNQTVCSCQKPFMPDHCKLIESLLNARKMEFKCENLTRGCQETLVEEDMISHQSECIYRLVKCPLVTCGLKMPFHELIEHM
eukprot:08662.XXX_142151_142999_1 [CDS] Oithona nana genome sequencing.